MIYHEAYEPLPDNTWTEILHNAIPTELKGFWAFRVRGSGVWANTGKTRDFETPVQHSEVHQEAQAFLSEGCSVSISPWYQWPQMQADIFGTCAREKGYDSIQFRPFEGVKPTGFYGNIGITEMVLVNSDGHNTCGTDDPSQTELRSGWMASRQCDCENTEIPDACGGWVRPPSMILTDPPVCALQRLPYIWRKCDPTTCPKSTCKLPTSK